MQKKIEIDVNEIQNELFRSTKFLNKQKEVFSIYAKIKKQQMIVKKNEKQYMDSALKLKKLINNLNEINSKKMLNEVDNATEIAKALEQ